MQIESWFHFNNKIIVSRNRFDYKTGEGANFLKKEKIVNEAIEKSNCKN